MTDNVTPIWRGQKVPPDILNVWEDLIASVAFNLQPEGHLDVDKLNYLIWHLHHSLIAMFSDAAEPEALDLFWKNYEFNVEQVLKLHRDKEL